MPPTECAKVLWEEYLQRATRDRASKLFRECSAERGGIHLFPLWQPHVFFLSFPGLPCLALCNAICLPFTLWSIWYQKFRKAKPGVLSASVCNVCFWLLFCMLSRRRLVSVGILPLRIEFFVLAHSRCYVYVSALTKPTLDKLNRRKMNKPQEHKRPMPYAFH